MIHEPPFADYRARPGGWHGRATRDGQLLDMRHLMDAWGNVDREVSDLRQ